SNPGVDYYDAKSASAAQVQDESLTISFATSPNITNAPKEASVRARESAFSLSIFGKTLTDVAPKKFVQIFIREELLPIAEGSSRP
ncbi:hypothetical protein K438DRAFT_1535316, partial [Mycena galopus ATCC 62051]